MCVCVCVCVSACLRVCLPVCASVCEKDGETDSEAMRERMGLMREIIPKAYDHLPVFAYSSKGAFNGPAGMVGVVDKQRPPRRCAAFHTIADARASFIVERRRLMLARCGRIRTDLGTGQLVKGLVSLAKVFCHAQEL